MRHATLTPYTPVSLTPDPDGLVLRSPYDAAFVAALKASVPDADRRWDGARKVWVIAPAQARAVCDLVETFYGIRLDPPASASAPAPAEIRAFRLEYLGQVKERAGGAQTAMGFCEGAWSIVAPEAVLRAWFAGQGDAPEPSGPAPTYYALLGVAPSADEAAIKAGYRRMARQWHPDVCREPDAAARFVAIKEAADVLLDPVRRKKYAAALLFEQRARETQPARPRETFRAPLRCGMIVAEARRALGRWTLTKILAWEDITDGAGRTLVTSWDTEREEISYTWTLA